MLWVEVGMEGQLALKVSKFFIQCLFFICWYHSSSSYSHICLSIYHLSGLLRWFSGKEFTCQCRRHRRCKFNLWVGKIPWKRKWQPTPVFLPRKSEKPGGLQPMGSQRIRLDWAQLNSKNNLRVEGSDKGFWVESSGRMSWCSTSWEGQKVLY